LAKKALKTDVDTLTTNKADKTYVDTQFANIVDGSPKGTYATLTDLQTAYPTGTTGVFILTSEVGFEGHWFYWNGSAWTDGGVYQNVGNGTITQEKAATGLALIEVDSVRTRNLFNKDTATQGYYPSSTTGALNSNAALAASDFIDILPNTTYHQRFVDSASHVAFYDASQAFISGVVNQANFTTPSNAEYVRITVRITNLDIDQLEVGTAFTEYEPYFKK
ncbi:hypothetical protein I7822_29555, partial [Metabacillus sp. BG109]|nr:hypothetical protein [Metabacillus bambusae]